MEILERSFNEVKHPDTSRREKLAKEVGLPAKTIQIWFQNRRARERKFGKEKRITDHSCIQQLDSSSPVKLHGYPSKFKSGKISPFLISKSLDAGLILMQNMKKSPKQNNEHRRKFDKVENSP